MGYIRRAFLVEKQDSSLVQVMRDAGAIPFVKTSMPIAGGADTSSPLWGQALNPLDKRRTPGGSSGGEAGMLAGGCSPLGFGTDLFGSIRYPAAACGIVGLTPSEQRISCTRKLGIYTKENLSASSLFGGVAGPLARRVDDLVVAMRVICSERAYKIDPYALPLPWREDSFSSTRKLRIGYFCGDQYISASVPAERALGEALDILRDKGHEVVPFVLPVNVMEVIRYSMRISQMDNFELQVESLEGEIVPKFHEGTVRSSFASQDDLKKEKAKLLKAGEERMALIVNTKQGGLQYLENGVALQKFVDKWHTAVDELELDAIVSTALVAPAPLLPLRSADGRLLFSLGICNMLGIPSGTVPVTTISENEAAAAEEYKDA